MTFHQPETFRAGFLVSSKVSTMSQSNDYRPDPQDGFSHDDELLHQVMQDEFETQFELGVDGDYAGYDDYLDNQPDDYEDYLGCYSPVDFCDGWDGE